MKVYIVIGESGEYSDREVWLITAHSDEEKAKWHVALATGRAKEIEVEMRESETGETFYDPDYSDLRNEFDPLMPYCRDNCYRYEETELVE